MDARERLRAELAGLEPAEFERRAARLRPRDAGLTEADGEHLPYVVAALRRELGHPEPRASTGAYWVGVGLLLALVALLIIRAVAGH
ncbi:MULTISPECIES: hypothetical protein [Kitasatospora]|uniref:Uncharacterized protein n=1 Tax=Kitasatospora setae (strain ATCC 33774 / DSM 43861 / JCM 3304 / KCC A-0304 / NBRC 14216 / KM-6054) TaxID=452652 RepID=E4N8W8_KITSK|nr:MULTISPECIES: hypothetical protein [Kitasatospora]BAJ27649.1 hypothetical protein KSE_18240 [Kitasatospora setae KM-6054]